MALKLRITGWALFLIGSILLMIVGQFDLKSVWTWTGLFVSLGGMLCTSLCNVIPAVARMRQLREQSHNPEIEPLTEESAERAREIIKKKTIGDGP